MKSTLKLFFFALSVPLFAQETPDDPKASLTLSGFADVFYQYDLNRPKDADRPGFLYNHNRHNEVNLNLAFLKAAYAQERVRANIALMAGTYVQDNLSGEGAAMQHLYEANVGVQIAPKWWLDAGVLPSHIGFESAKSSDCATLTRSLLAEYSPYYETGAKLSFAPNEKWSLSALWLNGWQRIARTPGNRALNFGTQINWKPNDKVQLNYSTFMGSVQANRDEITRIFHNVYGIFTLNPDWQLTLGFDLGTETNPILANDNKLWYSPVAIVRWQCAPKDALALRVENYSDADGAIFSDGLSMSGLSLNYDRKIGNLALWRVEGRFLQADKAVFFERNGDAVKTRPYLTTSLSIGF